MSRRRKSSLSAIGKKSLPSALCSIEIDGKVSIAYANKSGMTHECSIDPVFRNGVASEVIIIYTFSDANGMSLYVDGVKVPFGSNILPKLIETSKTH